MTVYVSRGEGDTIALAGKLAAALGPGDVVALVGKLGSGKTRFAGGVASGLGVEGVVASPTFVMMREYCSGLVPFIHVDAYRIGSSLEFEDLDVWESARDGVLVIEWADLVARELPPNRLDVLISPDHAGGRTITIEPRGTWRNRSLPDPI